MTTTTKEVTVAEIQSLLAGLDEEERNIPLVLGGKEQSLREAQSSGNFPLAAALSAEVDYLKDLGGNSLRERIRTAREKARFGLREALATELDREAAELEAKIESQKAKEDEALSKLEEASKCRWLPREKVVLAGLHREIGTIPQSEQWRNSAERRKNVAAQLRAVNPIQGQVLIDNLVTEALALVNNQ
jgi:hypothetical protein